MGALLHDDGKARCTWPSNEDTVYVTYHDEEWGVPDWDDRALFEKLILDGFQAGLSWITILRKRDEFRRAFDGFEPETIVRYGPDKIEELMGNAGIVRNRSKIVATIGNAKAYLEIMEDQGFSNYLWGFMDGCTAAERFPDHGRCTRRDTVEQGDLQGPQGARLPFLRADHRLCVHAGCRHGQRSSGGLLPPHRVRRARKTRPLKFYRLMATPDTDAPRAWQRMLSGRRLDLLNPSPLDIEIEDIAHGLARVARWNGQTSGDHAFSVAQHSMLVEQLCAHFSPKLDRRWRLAALLHDAAEYVIGDLISPFKAAIGLDYKSFENRLIEAVYVRFDLPPQPPEHVTKLVKRADRASAFLEATQLAGFEDGEAARIFKRPRGMSGAGSTKFYKLAPMPTHDAEQAYLEAFGRLK